VPPAELHVVKSFGKGIRLMSVLIHPEVSNAARFESHGVKTPFTSRPKTLIEVRGPVAPAGVTGLPLRSTVGLLANALPFWTPGK